MLRRASVKPEPGAVLEAQSAIWAKDHADRLLLAGDVQAALHGYGAALELDAEFGPLYANRAICQLRLGRWAACIADCEAAMARGLARSAAVLTRRGTALWRLGQLRAAIADYAAAHALHASPDLADDLRRMRERHALACKAAGDSAARSAEWATARAAYSEGLDALAPCAEAPDAPAEAAARLWSNRAVCALRLADWGGARADALAGLRALGTGPASRAVLLARLACAEAQLGNARGALQALERASAATTDARVHAELARDMARVRAHLHTVADGAPGAPASGGAA